jgi:hypothetical protein
MTKHEVSLAFLRDGVVTKAQHGIDSEALEARGAVKFRFEADQSDSLTGSPRYAKFG